MRHPYNMMREQRADTARRPKEPVVETGRVFWNDDEKRKVAKESFQILSRDKSMTSMEAIDIAQRKVLKPDRQRPLASVNFSKFRPWINPLWDEIGGTKDKQAKAKENLGELFQPEVTPMPAQAIAEAPEAEAPATPPANQTVVGTHSPASNVTALPHDPPTHDTRTLVRWTDDEKRTLAARVHYLLGHFHDMRPLEALRKAIESELPEDRQRDIAGWSIVETWIDPMIAQLKLDEQIAELQAREEREREARERAEQLLQEQAEQERIEAQVQERVEAVIAQRVAAMQPSGLEAIIGLFAQRFADTFVNAVSESVSKAVAQHIGNLSFGQPTQHEEKLAVPPKDRLPRICVVGLYRQQEEDVAKAFLGTAEFVFVKSTKEGGNGHGGAGMVTKAATCDIVVSMVDHAGVDVETHAKHLKIPFKRVPGGASACKRFITAWLTGEYSAGVTQ